MGTFSYTTGSAMLGGQTNPIGVFKYIDGDIFTLPNVFAWEISYRDSDEIPTARFGYLMDDRAANYGFPTQFEQLWPLAIAAANDVGPYVVLPDDRILVYAGMPDGSVDLLFDGFARLPQVDVSGDGQHQVSFSAVGVAIRCYDVPIQGRIQRNGGLSQCQTTDGSEDVPTNLPTRFNPADERHPTGQPNCTPENYDSDPDGKGPAAGYPVFLDPNIDRPGDAAHSPRLWTLSGAVKYLLARYNPPTEVAEESDDPPTLTYQQFVQNPDFTDLDSILDNRAPLPGQMFFDPTNPATYTSSPIIVRDFDCTNMAWPEAVSRLLGYHGFGMRWVTGQYPDGSPYNTFEVYRKDAANPDDPKWVFLPPKGAPIDPQDCNVGHLSAAFDYHGIANSFVVETHPNRYEISVIIPPLFTPSSGDAAASGDARKKFLRANLDGQPEAVRRAYRWYGADELGDGYYDLQQKKWVTAKPFDFSALWPDAQDPDTGAARKGYCVRFRPPTRDCLTDDGNGDTFKAELALSRNYAGPARGLWDGTGDWQPIEGDWKLLDDRLGIEFTADSPDAIHCGKSNLKDKTQNSGPVLKGIKSIASPGTSAKSDATFYLRLTCVIEADQTLEGSAPKRLASPLGNEVRRRINAKDHFRKDTIHTSSAFFDEEWQNSDAYTVDKDGNLLARDDTQAANDYAAQLRAAHEFPSLPAAITIPWLSLAYPVGSRISLIAGRDASLQTNAGTESGSESPSYPFVVGVQFSFSGDQQVTILQLSDRRLEPQPLEHRRGR